MIYKLQKITQLSTVLIFLSLFTNCTIMGKIKTKADTIIAKLSVSTHQEQNFNVFMSWLDTQGSFENSEGIKSAYRSVFTAMKQNDYIDYVSLGKKLDDEFEKLSQEQREAIYQFFLTLPYKSAEPSKLPGENSCEVSCLFGSCSITCPAGTKPKCFCTWYGSPQCGCEPF